MDASYIPLSMSAFERLPTPEGDGRGTYAPGTGVITGITGSFTIFAVEVDNIPCLVLGLRGIVGFDYWRANSVFLVDFYDFFVILLVRSNLMVDL